MTPLEQLHALLSSAPPWLNAVVSLFGLYIWWKVWSEKASTRTRLDNLEGDIADRLERIETQHLAHTLEIKELPGLKDLGQIYERVNSIDGELQRLVGQVAGINRHIDMLTEHHLRD